MCNFASLHYISNIPSISCRKTKSYNTIIQIHQITKKPKVHNTSGEFSNKYLTQYTKETRVTLINLIFVYE